MKSQILSQALEQVKNPNILVNMVSQRVRQLGQGHKALVPTDVQMSHMEIALKEIAEGKLGYETTAPALLVKPVRSKASKRK